MRILITKTFLLLIISIVISSYSLFSQIVDSDITLAKALEGSSAPDSILNRLVIVDVEYYSSDSLLHRGQIVVDRSIESKVVKIFEYIKQIRYPVEMVVPIKFDLTGGNTTMATLNNTYSFHYRAKAGNKNSLSRHSLGLAIDFNPFDNPYISDSGKVLPPGGVYDTTKAECLTKQSKLVKEMCDNGWIWGGNWTTPKDYMHFEIR